MKAIFFLQALVSSVSAGTVLWDGRLNDLTASTDLNKWSFSSEVGPYQYYIHGPGAVTEYVNFDPTYKNPADTASSKGAKLTIDDTSYWNGQNMRRTELIPQTTAPINQGKVYYHFSMKRSNTNAPNSTLEHQVCFFESHFTEMKYGLLSGAQGTSDTNLRWMVNGVSQWNVVWAADTWHNIAYEIDFSANTVGFWHSTGSDALTQVIAPMSVSTSSNGADWHLGVLRLPMSSALLQPDVEDWYFSGVYIESGSLTTSVTGPGGSGSSSGGSSSAPAKPTTTAASAPVTTSKVSTTSKAAPTTLSTATSAAPAPTGGSIAKYGQCGGSGWTGSGTCAAGSTCTVVNPYYSQCL